MGSLELSTNGFLAPAVRLDDAQLASAEAIAAAPLPVLAQADAQFLAQCLRMLDTLPRRKDDDVSGQLRVRAYEIAIGATPKEAVEFMVTEALRTCKFFPSTSECVEILSRWSRNDEALRERQRAEVAARHERQARFDDAMRRLSTNQCTPDEIARLPARWKEMAETYGYLRREDDGSYSQRSVTVPCRSISAPRSYAAAACRECQDVGRILTIEGDEIDCPGCCTSEHQT